MVLCPTWARHTRASATKAQVSSLAHAVTQQWKRQVAEAEAAASSKAGQGQAAQAGASGGAARAEGGGVSSRAAAAARAASGPAHPIAPAGSGVAPEVRSKALELLVAALRGHVAVRSTKGGAGAAPDPAPAPSNGSDLILAADLRQLARRVEQAVHAQCCAWAASGRCSSGDPAGLRLGHQWGAGQQATSVAAYRAKLRLLLPALRLADGVAPRLLEGRLSPAELVTLGSDALASDIVRAQVRRTLAHPDC
jgi:hypothetical protein